MVTTKQCIKKNQPISACANIGRNIKKYRLLNADIEIFTMSAAVFLIRSYGAPNGIGRCSVAQCYDITWAMLAQSKIKLGQYCQ